jgi:hypothetical protein
MTASIQPNNARTAEVFSTGMPVHLRGNMGGAERMVPVTCVGVSPQGEELMLQWSEEASAQSAPPARGLPIQVYTVASGVLYVTSGEVSEITEGKVPLIRCETKDLCVAIPMRKYTRYQVRGQVRLGDVDQPHAYRQQEPESMDISEGGFGLPVPDRGWATGQEVGFHLRVWVARGGEPLTAYPILELGGRAFIRNVRPTGNEGEVFVGLQFSSLLEIQEQALQLWLAAHVSFLREA